MSTDIVVCHEKKVGGTYERRLRPKPYDDQSYALFAWLAGVRNYCGIEPLSAPRGLPPGVSYLVEQQWKSWGSDAYGTSWFDVAELLAVDYSAPVENRRISVRLSQGFFSGAGTCEPGQGEKTTLGELIGTGFLNYLNRLEKAGISRIVFWFSS